MKVSPHFTLQEFVPREVFERMGADALSLIDPKLIELAEFVRVFFGKPMIINNWASGGQYNESGYREASSTTGAAKSQHKLGKAIDIKIPGLKPKFIYEQILANEAQFMAHGLTTMENIEFTTTWNHLDIRVTGKAKIWIVKPKPVKK